VTFWQWSRPESKAGVRRGLRNWWSRKKGSGGRSTQPCIPPGPLNRVPASAGVKAGMSPLLCDPIWHVNCSRGVATLVSKLLYPCYFTLLTHEQPACWLARWPGSAVVSDKKIMHGWKSVYREMMEWLAMKGDLMINCECTGVLRERERPHSKPAIEGAVIFCAAPAHPPCRLCTASHRAAPVHAHFDHAHFRHSPTLVVLILVLIIGRGWWRWALVGSDGVAPSRMVSVCLC